MILCLLVMLTASLGWTVDKIECQSASALIQQYSECKNLTMMLTNDSYWGYYYIRNSSIPNNTLDDTYYQRLGLGNMSFDQAFAFIKKIYTDLHYCNSEYCKCAKLGPDGRMFYYYKSFFLNNANFKGVKAVIQEFNKNLSSQSRSLADAMMHTYNGNLYPTITSFLMKYDYTSSKILNNYLDIVSTVCDYYHFDYSV